MKRWSPGKGFIKLSDHGNYVIWMKPLHDGALLAAYLPGYGKAGNEHYEKWIIKLPRGTDFHWDILDKPWRIRWLLRDQPEPGSTLWGVEILTYTWCNPSHRNIKEQTRRRWCGWHRGYKHTWTWRRRRPWEGEWGLEHRHRVPRKILARLQPGIRDLKLWQTYMDKLRAQWEKEE